MNFSEADLHDAGLLPDEISTIKNMYQGGKSNQRGNDYEESYAVHCLVEAIEHYLLEGSDTCISFQELAAVDDIVLRQESFFTFCQLKRSDQQTWNRDELKTKFFLQKKICENSPRVSQYELRLVTPHVSRQQLLQQKIPDDLATCTQIVLFEVEKRSDMWSLQSPCNGSLRTICAHGAERPGTREIVIGTLYHCLMKYSQGCCVEDVFAYVMQQHDEVVVPLKLRNWTYPVEWQEVKKILMNVQALNVYIEAGFCYWTYMFEEGVVGHIGTDRLTRFLKRIISTPPKDFEAFWSLLP